ncbi:hypothetical protein BCV72DRAFT_331327 [Rhizopus microsporus var. microsporus]|uniref:Transposase Tc1-like domain-containing protein n=1 Tax=Rhizopus microsporus var. microsporus TaxID=86635 RepID=A0A1X0R041_RHIZD|nr:hypothetical protein BCV72DRAFT_331327 [Rhizopus microsporus var. microsporus]
MVGMKRTTVQVAIDRVASTSIILVGKGTDRPSTFDEYTQRYLEQVIRRDLFQTIGTLKVKLRLMDKAICRSTLKKWIKQLDFRYHSPASKPKLTEKQKRKRLD